MQQGGRSGAGPERSGQHAVVSALSGPLRRIVSARLADEHLVDDVVQETLARVLETRDRVADDVLLPYAVIVARNLVTSRGRRDTTAQRNAARLVDLNTPPSPEDALLRAEEAEAVRAALRALPDAERETLIAHEVHDVDTKALARSGSSTPGAVAAQLARARARMRLEYVLALRRVSVPTASCRPVLMALSMADQRRQKALGAGSHLLTCATCAALSGPLLTRKRGLAEVVPGGFVVWMAGMKPPRPSARSLSQLAAATVATVVVAAGFVLSRPAGGDPDPGSLPTDPGSLPTDPGSPPTDPGLLIGAQHPVVARSVLMDAGRSDETISVEDATVLSVPADEGFWIAHGGGRLWVQLSGSGESAFQVRPGQHLSFQAQPVQHQPRFARQIGLPDRAGARALSRQRMHLRVGAETLTRS